MRVASQCPVFRPRPVATDGSPWLALPGCQVPEPVAAWPARVPGRGRRCQRAEQGRHDLASITWCGVASPVAERADGRRSPAGLGEGTGRPRRRSRLMRFSRRGVWTIPDSLDAEGAAAFSQLEVLLPAPPSGRIPAFPLRVHRLLRRFAQVIHMLTGTAGQQCCCRACETRRHAGR